MRKLHSRSWIIAAAVVSSALLAALTVTAMPIDVSGVPTAVPAVDPATELGEALERGRLGNLVAAAGRDAFSGLPRAAIETMGWPACTTCLWNCMKEFNACRRACDGPGWQDCLDDCVTAQEYCQNVTCAGCP